MFCGSNFFRFFDRHEPFCGELKHKGNRVLNTGVTSNHSIDTRAFVPATSPTATSFAPTFAPSFGVQQQQQVEGEVPAVQAKEQFLDTPVTLNPSAEEQQPALSRPREQDAVFDPFASPAIFDSPFVVDEFANNYGAGDLSVESIDPFSLPAATVTQSSAPLDCIPTDPFANNLEPVTTTPTLLAEDLQAPVVGHSIQLQGPPQQ